VTGAVSSLAARVYRVSDDRSPTVVFVHGGGWVAGDLETHDRQPRLLAIETGAVVVSVDYRRPPETRFPGAFEDSFAALRDVSARIAEFGGDGVRLGVAGDSAGGNLAAAVAIGCRDASITLAAQLLAYPVIDVAGNNADPTENARFPSRAENAQGYFLSRAVMEWFAGHYLADSGHGEDWRVSPLHAKNMGGARAGGGLHGVFRSVARRRQSLRRARRCRCRDQVPSWRRPDPRLFSAMRPKPPGPKRSAPARISRRCSNAGPNSQRDLSGRTRVRLVRRIAALPKCERFRGGMN
jgi:acetyl esterase